MAHHLHALMTLALLPPGASGMGLRAAHEPNADAARMPRQRLAGGGQMPMSGIGLSAVKGTRAHDATLEFLRAGGRLLDTAEHYGNHGQVGAAIREAIKDHGVRREDVFLTTKLPQTLFERGNATRWVKTMLHDLGVDYVDLVLLHTGGSPFKSPEQLGITGCKTWSQCRRQAWLALSDARDAGQIRAVGVSNFGPRQMRELIRPEASPDRHESARVQPVGSEAVAVGRRLLPEERCRGHGFQFHRWRTSEGQEILAGRPREAHLKGP